MPVVGSGGENPKTKRKPKLKKRKVSQAPARVPDRQDPVTRPVTKERMYAHPQRPAAQKVFNAQAKADARAKARRATKRAAATDLKERAGRIKVTPGPSPDARDSSRSPAQLERDASFVTRNVRVSRLKANVKADRTQIRAAVTGRGGKVIDTSAAFKRQQEATKAQTAQRLAPVLKVLEQTTRVNHAIAGAADAAVTGKDISRAAKRGIQNKDKTTFSTVLKHAGVENKALQTVGGFTLDVGTDPTTFVTGGAGSVASKSAVKAGERAANKAIAKNLTEAQVQRFRERATAQALKTGDHTKGATVKFMGKEIPGVRKATAVASKPVRAAGRKATPGKLRAAVRGVGADLNPNITPAGATREQSRKAIQVTRTARAKTNEGDRQAVNFADGVRRRVGEANYRLIEDAIERNKIGSLPESLREPARQIRDTMRHANRLRKQAGIRGGEVKARPQVPVPEVVADVGQSAKDLSRAKRREIAARREVADLRDELNVSQGRAEVLSRNVSGTKGENAAERAARLRKAADSRAGQRGSAKDVLKFIDRVEAGQKYAGGGHGVTATQAAIHEAEQHASSRARQLAHAEATHATTKTERAAQAAARKKALKTNAKRAVAPKSYLPHALTDEGIEAAGHTAPTSSYGATGAGGKGAVRPTSSKARADDRNLPLSELRQKYPGQYREDLHATLGERVAQGHASAAQAGLNRRLADLGTPLKKGSQIPAEADVFHIKGSNIRPVTDRAEKQAIVDTGHGLGKEGNGGRYVILSGDVVKRAQEGTSPQLKGGAILHGFDKGTSGFKRLALATPGFHVRNLIGDSAQAYVHQPAPKLAGNMRRSAAVLRAVGKQEKAAKGLGRPAPSGKTLKTGKYGEVPLEEVADKLVKAGAARSGYTAGELRELASSGNTGLKIKKPKSPAAVKRAFLNREDLPRLATAIYHLRQGATWEEAAQKVADVHIDYQHLTSFERNFARRLMPFYCVPVDHEILTRRGFKYHQDLTVGEDVLSLDHETGELEWTPLLEVATFDYDGPLKTIKRRGADFAFTPDHRWPVVTCESFVKGKWYGGKRVIKRTHDLGTSDRIPLVGNFQGTTSTLTVRHASILGWLIGDGYFRWRGDHCEMLVYQSPKKYLDEIADLLGTRRRPPHPQTGVVAVPVARMDVQALVGSGFRTKDDLLRLVGGLSRDAAEAMWAAMFKAEGWTDANGQQGFVQVAGPVLEAFQMLCLMTGRTCNIGPARQPKPGWSRQATHQAYVRKSTHLQVGKLGEEHYTGTIWCPRTKHGTWVMRHNGTVVITGNTWTARNVPIQTKALIQRPGKFATYQKIRESAAGFVNPGEVDPETKDLYKQLEASGVKMTGGYEKYLSEWEQRNASVPISWKGHKFTVSVGLPLGDLNELPGAAGSAQAEEWFKKAMSMGNPIAKNPVEWFNNFSFFFRDQIERDTSPYVAAPRYVEAMPKGMQEKLGVKKIIDKRSGKKVWGWRGKTDYFFKQAPGIPNYAQQFATEGHDRRGKGPAGKTLAFMGVKAVPLDPTSNAVSLAYARQQEIQKELAGLRQEGIGKDNPTPEWRKLNDQLKIVGQIAYQGKAKRGDKVLPTSGGPPKLKKNAGFKFDGGGQDFDFSSGSQDFDFG